LKGFPARNPSKKKQHPLLGIQLDLALGDKIFESYLSINSLDYLFDHQIDGRVVLPGSAYLEMALAAALDVFGSGSHGLKDVAILQAMVFLGCEIRTVQFVLKQEHLGEANFSVYSIGGKENDRETFWTQHAIGRIQIKSGSRSFQSCQESSLKKIRARCKEELQHETFYERFLGRYWDHYQHNIP